jgi:hypothetical protein
VCSIFCCCFIYNKTTKTKSISQSTSNKTKCAAIVQQIQIICLFFTFMELPICMWMWMSMWMSMWIRLCIRMLMLMWLLLCMCMCMFVCADESVAIAVAGWFSTWMEERLIMCCYTSSCQWIACEHAAWTCACACACVDADWMVGPICNWTITSSTMLTMLSIVPLTLLLTTR